MHLDGGELVVVERPGLLEDRGCDRELADVVQQPADGEAAQAGWGETELRAELDRECGNAGACALGRRVLRGEAHHQGAHARSEIRLLRGDDLGGAQVADERS